MSSTLQIVLTFLIGAGTVGGTWYLLPANRGKIEADTAAVLTKSAGEWVERLTNRINYLEGEIESIRKDNHALEVEIDELKEDKRRLEAWSKVLVAQVIENGGIPILLAEIS